MTLPRSPLFPDASLALSPRRDDEPSTLVPQLPSSPQISTSTLQVYIVPAEKHLFVQGFKPAEYETRPPTLLRGSLVVRVLKANKIKAISLTFKGAQKTDWPEGIPPKRSSYTETNDLINHSWPFYQADSHMPNFGADIVVPAGKTGGPDDVTHLSLDAHSSPHLAQPSTVSSLNTLLAAPDPGHSSFAASLMKMATSTTHSLSPVSSLVDLSAMRSASHDVKPGSFPPGDYVYNFEHPIPASSPETISAAFGIVNYSLETTITRSTTFKSNLTAKLPIDVIRIPSDNSVEENEPIIIERDWEDQLRYEIVVASKSVVLDTYLPMSLKFIPLFGKVALHRIRVYITEDCNYYCANKTVHRKEPTRKYLLLEHKAKKNQSLLSKDGGTTATFDPEVEVLPRELEFQMFVPSTINKKFDYTIHPDTGVENIQCNHWIKISLRISKQDPDNPEKRKHFEISIDSPIHLFSPLAAHQNTLLPVYTTQPEFLPEYTQLPPTSPGVTAIDASHHPTNQSILSIFGGASGHRDSPELPRPSTPIQFQHISSSMDNDDPIHRDHDMHLDSNLYKPENDEVLNAIGSPQATAFSPVASPVASPVRNPPEPSIRPPSFSIMGVAEDTLPPAYEEETSMSLSPLRLDSPARENSPAGGIKNKLSKQLENRGRNSLSEKSSLKSNGSSSQSVRGQRNSNESVKAGGRSEPALSESATKDSESIDPLCPSVETDNSSSGKTLEPDNRFHVKGMLQPQNDTLTTAIYRRKPSTDSQMDDLSADITEFCPPLVPAANAASRNSSIASVNYRGCMHEDDIGQTFPLLSTNDTRLSEDFGRHFDPMGSMNDLVASNRFDDHRVPSSLTHFRNPRLSKHYQEDPEEDKEILMALDKSRQKSFGVIPDVRYNSPSDEETDASKTTLNEIGHSAKDMTYEVPHGNQQMMLN